MIRDGLLTEAGPRCFLERDLAASPHSRARALATASPQRDSLVVAVAETAAWVYLGGELDWPLQFAAPHGHKPPQLPGIYRGRCMVFSGDQLWRLGRLTLTSPTATATELARYSPRGEAIELIRLLAQAYSLSREQLDAHLRRENLRPCTAHAREILDFALRPAAAPQAQATAGAQVA